MDSFFLEVVARELAGRIAGARIEKVHQPEADIIILRLWTGREKVNLLFGCAAGQARVHLTEVRWANPFTPPRFCQLLRARLARIVAVDKVAQERSLRFVCRGSAGEEYRLMAELHGTRANLLLLDGEGKIVDALKRSAGGREALPGQPYQAPPPPSRHSLAGSMPAVPPLAEMPGGFERWLLDHVSPMSLPVAADLTAAVAAGAAPADALADLRQKWLSGEGRPTIAVLHGQRLLTILPLPHLPLTQVEAFSSPSLAADRFYAAAAAPPARREELRAAIASALRRLQARQKKIEADRQGTEDAQARRQTGELLLGNLHRMRRGMAEIVVENYYVEPAVPLRIPLEPQLSPQENAERYFRAYKKKERGREHVERRLRETAAEIAWLEAAAHYLDEAQSPEELTALRRELVEAGLLPAAEAHAPRHKLPDLRDSLRRGRTPAGFQLWWGKNARTNEYVSRELTGSDDFWFHVHDKPGCHLVLKRAGRPQVPEEDQLFAAAVAAGYSQARGEAKVAVIVAEGKHVRQPRGARPGQVVVEHYRTVMVAPQRLEADPPATETAPTLPT